jgi:hypothetical protein
MRRILLGRERIAAREIILDRFSDCSDGLKVSRTSNAGLHDFLEILAIAMGAVPCKGQGAGHRPVREGERAILARVSQAREWRAQPCHP